MSQATGNPWALTWLDRPCAALVGPYRESLQPVDERLNRELVSLGLECLDSDERASPRSQLTGPTSGGVGPRKRKKEDEIAALRRGHWRE